MIKKTVTYTTWDDEEITEDFYFNFTKQQLLKLEVGAQGGSLKELLEKVLAAEDNAVMVDEFEQLLKRAYGKKSEDGRLFDKDPEIQEAFAQSPAFSDIFFGIIEDETATYEFIVGILPADMKQDVIQAAADRKAAEATNVERPQEGTGGITDTTTDSLNRPVTD